MSTAERLFYRELTANFRTAGEEVRRQFATDDALILEQLMTGTVTGEMLGVRGNGRRIRFRILHVSEFRDGLISRENIWLDAGAIIGQLAA